MKNYEILNKTNDASIKPIKGWTVGVPVEEDAIKQLTNLASMPFIHSHVAVMPDVHVGKGATVGSVIATKGAVIPAAVGVDIGCGMAAVRTSLKASDLPDDLSYLRSMIEQRIPPGRTDNGGSNDRGAWGAPVAFDHQTLSVRADARTLQIELEQIVAKHPKLERPSRKAWSHCGTLGTGNHFVEICLDEKDDVWIVLHSGSRGIGNAIGTYFIEKAKEEMRRYFINLPDADLAFLPSDTENYKDYLVAVSWAQRFAALNRTVMMHAAIDALHTFLQRPIDTSLEAVNCHHNYVSHERHFNEDVLLTRKGAVDAHEGKLGIIPGSMGERTFIVRGKGNREAFCSCSHGAGRLMSRTEARKKISLAEHVADTAGIECRKDYDVIDESPRAYKPLDAVMAAQDDLVEIVHTLHQVVCVKG